MEWLVKQLKKFIKKMAIIFYLLQIRSELNLFDLKTVKKWFIKNKPDTVVVIAAAKVGGIFANSSQPTEFLLENLKIQNNLIETS